MFKFLKKCSSFCPSGSLRGREVTLGPPCKQPKIIVNVQPYTCSSYTCYTNTCLTCCRHLNIRRSLRSHPRAGAPQSSSSSACQVLRHSGRPLAELKVVQGNKQFHFSVRLMVYNQNIRRSAQAKQFDLLNHLKNRSFCLGARGAWRGCLRTYVQAQFGPRKKRNKQPFWMEQGSLLLGVLAVLGALRQEGPKDQQKVIDSSTFQRNENHGHSLSPNMCEAE